MQSRPVISAVLRALWLAVLLQFALGLLADAGDPYVPFGTVFLMYLAIAGIPLAVLGVLLVRCCRKSGEPLLRIGSVRLCRTAAWALPISGLLRLCFSVLFTAESNRLTALDRALRQLPVYFGLGLVLCGCSLLLRRRK